MVGKIEVMLVLLFMCCFIQVINFCNTKIKVFVYYEHRIQKRIIIIQSNSSQYQTSYVLSSFVSITYINVIEHFGLIIISFSG